MELSHFINSTPASGITARSLVAYNAANGLGNFTGNINLSNTVQYTIDDSSQDSYWTFACTFNKNLNNAQILFNNYDPTNYKGFTVGLTDGNFLYVDSHGGSHESYIFDQINLGVKNCIAIQRTDRDFSVSKYDLQSRVFESRQVRSFSPSAVLDCDYDIEIAGTTSNYTGRFGNGSIGRFNGTMDQFVYFADAIEEPYLLSIMSGFLPLTLTPSSSYTYTLLDESYRSPEGYYDAGHAQLDAYFSGTNANVFGDIGPGKWIGTGVGTISLAGMTGHLLYMTGLDACNATGNYHEDLYIGAGTGDYTTFSDIVRVYIADFNPSVATISHNMTFNRSGVQFHVDYDASYSYTSTTGTSFAESGAYYTGFKMNGVTSLVGNQIALATDTGVAPTGYNINGLFDNAKGAFSLPGWNSGTGIVYYNGTGYLQAGNFSVTGEYIYLQNFTESSNDYLIGDISKNSTFLNSGVNYWATGNFYPNTSIVFSGRYSTGRMKKTDYLENSTHHLYYRSPVQPTGTTFLFSL